jgi:S1-C subfamily serine protease
VELVGSRGGEPLSLSVALVESPRSERELAEYRDRRFDFAVRDLTFQDRRDPRISGAQSGALVTGVESGGWAALARLAVGDIVLAVDGRPVSSGDDLEAEMRRVVAERPRHVVFQVRRGVSTLFLELEPDWSPDSMAAVQP